MKTSHSREQFEEIVVKVLDELPDRVKKYVNNVSICVEERPNPEQLEQTGTRRGEVLLGLYEGVPETEWGKGFGNTLPDKITLFQESIEQFCGGVEDIEQQVKATIWHEIAHHVGFPEEEIRNLERKHGFSS